MSFCLSGVVVLVFDKGQARERNRKAELGLLFLSFALIFLISWSCFVFYSAGQPRPLLASENLMIFLELSISVLVVEGLKKKSKRG